MHSKIKWRLLHFFLFFWVGRRKKSFYCNKPNILRVVDVCCQSGRRSCTFLPEFERKRRQFLRRRRSSMAIVKDIFALLHNFFSGSSSPSNKIIPFTPKIGRIYFFSLSAADPFNSIHRSVKGFLLFGQQME